MGALFENKRRYNTIQSLTFLTSSVLNLAIKCGCSIYYMYLIFLLDIIFPFVVVVPAYPASTGILTHSLPEWAFRARPGLWRICLCPKVARIAEHKFGSC